MSNGNDLVDELRAEGVLRTPAIINAFRAIDRRDFVLEEIEAGAYLNIPLPIGEGQTISQPYTVAFMLELLQPQAGDNILDIGSGSGWQTALLAYVVGQVKVSGFLRSMADAFIFDGNVFLKARNQCRYVKINVPDFTKYRILSIVKCSYELYSKLQ